MVSLLHKPSLAYAVKTLIFTAFLSVGLVATSVRAANTPEADRAWQTILEQAAGPGSNFRSQEAALTAARQHLDKQIAALQDFEQKYPADSRHYSAEIRLATVLAAKARVRHEPAVMDEARRILSDLENNPGTPMPVKADAGFARVSQRMQDIDGHVDEETRSTLLQTIRDFDATYPGDRRTGNLLAEVAGLYDDQPVQKKTLLEEASGKVKDEEGRDRINDDLRRLSLLGQSIDLRMPVWNGGPPLNLTERRGRVQVLLFWASFSLPSLHELASLQQLAAQFVGQPVDFITVSVDSDRAALTGLIKTADLRWPTGFDGKGWTGEEVRRLGINAVPTVWVLDRKGRLLSLNARGEEAETIRRALAVP